MVKILEGGEFQANTVCLSHYHLIEPHTYTLQSREREGGKNDSKGGANIGR